MGDRVHRSEIGQRAHTHVADHQFGSIWHVGGGTARQIVDSDHCLTAGQQRPAEMATDEAGATGHDDAAGPSGHTRPTPHARIPALRHSASGRALRASTTLRTGIAATGIG